MEVIQDISQMSARALAEKAKGKSIGFVPTMGFLHEGHLSLVRAARKENDLVIASIFVNPLQFGPKEDFSGYPRDAEGDRKKLTSAQCDIVFEPKAEAFYPEGFGSLVEVPQGSDVLCGKFRPGHFRGVATIVAKLFHAVLPDSAYFGEKDYQQLQIIRKMVQDLNFPVRIQGLPTVRDADGLAMSSRNTYLTPEERRKALAIPKALDLAQKKCAKGIFPVQEVLSEVEAFLREDKCFAIEYVEIVQPESLKLVLEVGKGSPGRLLVAVKLLRKPGAKPETVRLIDNNLLGSNEEGERR